MIRDNDGFWIALAVATGAAIGLLSPLPSHGETVNLGDCPTVAAVPAPKAHHHAITRRVAFHRRHVPVCHCGDAFGGGGGSSDVVGNSAFGGLDSVGGGEGGWDAPSLLYSGRGLNLYGDRGGESALSPGGPLPNAAPAPELSTSLLLTIGFGAIGVVAYRKRA